MTQQERRMYLIKSLLAEDRRYEDVTVPAAEVEQRRLLRLNGRALPMGSVTRTRTAYRRVEQRLTVQAATALAKAALEEKRAQELPGATIIHAYVTVEVTPDTVTAVGAYTVQVQSLQTDRDRA